MLSRRRRHSPASAIVAVLAVLTMAFVACGEEHSKDPGPTITRPSPEGDARTLRLGFSTLPAELTDTAYVDAFATAAQYGDVVLIQRTPPWEDFLPGATISNQTTETTRGEVALLDQYKGLQRFYAIDPTDGAVQRSRIANLPAGIDPQQGFNAPDLREAFIAYTAYVVKNYQPDYLAIGVEINMLYERSQSQYEAFVSLYRDAYAQAKAASPHTKVFPTFQLEDLLGTFGTIHPPHWEVLDDFRGMMDALAISTYPYLGDLRVANDLQADYYSQLRQHFDGEILVSEAGYPSAPVEGASVVGTEEDQEAFLQRLLGDAQANNFGLVVWFAALDPSFASSGIASVFRDIGLRKSDGSNKLAWADWEAWARRPLN